MSLGVHETEVFRILRSNPSELLGGTVQHDCLFPGCDLVLSFRWDGTLYRIGYNEPWLNYHGLAADSLIPNDVNELNCDN